MINKEIFNAIPDEWVEHPMYLDDEETSNEVIEELNEAFNEE